MTMVGMMVSVPDGPTDASITHWCLLKIKARKRHSNTRSSHDRQTYCDIENLSCVLCVCVCVCVYVSVSVRACVCV